MYMIGYFSIYKDIKNISTKYYDVWNHCIITMGNTYYELNLNLLLTTESEQSGTV